MLSWDTFKHIIDQPMLAEEYAAVSGVPYVVVDLREQGRAEQTALTLPATPVIGFRPAVEKHPPWVDVIAHTEAELETLKTAITAQGQAAATLVQVLRHNEHTSVVDGLLAESLAYSTLQQSAGFAEWLAQAEHSAKDIVEKDVLLVERNGDSLHLTLNRPHVHNAYNTALKDALCEALYLAHADPQLDSVHIDGNGPSFCAGGDLTEFGSVTDAAAAHLSRTSRGAGRLLAQLPCTSRVDVHGACIGAGIEIPAFASRIHAASDAFFMLPEVAMGLIPGAGGTVSITRRIGRHRCAWMALTGERVSAQTALDWGLIDAVSA